MGEPTQPRHPFLEWPGPIAFAHRGGGGEAPENTMPAFQHAVDLGYTFLETDVRITADGVAVAFHDEDLNGPAGGPERISDLPWRELATVRVRRRGADRPAGGVFGTWPGRPHQRRLQARRGRSSRWRRCVERSSTPSTACSSPAFDDRRLQWLRRRLGPRACTNAGIAEVGALRFTGWTPSGAQATQIPVRRYGMPIATRAFVRRAHARGLAVHVWTIDDPAEMERLLDLGVDGIMTDRPSVLKDVLRAEVPAGSDRAAVSR